MDAAIAWEAVGHEGREVNGGVGVFGEVVLWASEMAHFVDQGSNPVRVGLGAQLVRRLGASTDPRWALHGDSLPRSIAMTLDVPRSCSGGPGGVCLRSTPCFDARHVV